MKAAIYTRFSTDQQDTTSTDGQIANCEALAAREDLQIVAKYKDEGISGNDDSRPGYQRMLADLSVGKFAGIICDETSRITRNQAELHRLVAELNFRDQFLITGDGVDTRSESSELLLSVKAAVDAMEGRKIGYRTYRSLRERHKAGHCAGGRIYGYTTEQDGDYRKRVIVPDQAEIVFEIFQRYADGESSKNIARSFNERGIRSPASFWKKPRARGWGHTTLIGSQAKASGILRNPIYKGLVTWNKRGGKKKPGTGQRIQKRRPESEWICVQDETLRIVSDELFERVQTRLRNARRTTNGRNLKTRPVRYLLSGILKCDSCGGHYVVKNSVSYGCSSHTNGRDVFCEQRGTIKREKAEGALLAGIKEQLSRPDIVREMAKTIRKRLRQSKPSKRAAKREIAEIDVQIRNVVDSLASIGRSDALATKLRELEDKRFDVNASLQAAEKVVDFDGRSAQSKWLEIVGDLENLRNYATPDEVETARGMLREIIGEVIVKETPDGTFAYPAMQPPGVYISGAEKRT